MNQIVLICRMLKVVELLEKSFDEIFLKSTLFSCSSQNTAKGEKNNSLEEPVTKKGKKTGKFQRKKRLISLYVCACSLLTRYRVQTAKHICRGGRVKAKK